MKAQGIDVLNLSIGQDFNTKHIRPAAIKAIESGKVDFTAAVGIEPLKRDRR